MSETDLKLMRLIDELHLEHPFADAQMLRDMLWLGWGDNVCVEGF